MAPQSAETIVSDPLPGVTNRDPGLAFGDTGFVAPLRDTAQPRLGHPARRRTAIQNENLVLWVDGVAKAIVPDLIMNLEIETGEPITTEMLRYGQQLAVIGIPAHDLMKTPEALKVVGPKAFGYPELEHVPLASSSRGSARALQKP
jgi:hypothetical protein